MIRKIKWAFWNSPKNLYKQWSRYGPYADEDWLHYGPFDNQFVTTKWTKND